MVELSLLDMEDASGGFVWLLALAAVAVLEAGCTNVKGSISCTGTTNSDGSSSASCTGEISGNF